MAVEHAANTNQRIDALGVAINLEELNPAPFLKYLQTQLKYYYMDQGPIHPDFGDDEGWVDMIEEFTLAYQDGEFRIFEGLDTEDGAVELFELLLVIEGTETCGFWIEIKSSLIDEVVRVKTGLNEASETQLAEFSEKLLQAIKSSARIELERSICR